MGEARLFPGVRHIGISIFLDFSLEGLKHFSVTPPSPSATLYVQIPFPRIGALLPALIFLIRQSSLGPPAGFPSPDRSLFPPQVSLDHFRLFGTASTLTVTIAAGRVQVTMLSTSTSLVYTAHVEQTN